MSDLKRLERLARLARLKYEAEAAGMQRLAVEEFQAREDLGALRTADARCARLDDAGALGALGRWIAAQRAAVVDANAALLSIDQQRERLRPPLRKAFARAEAADRLADAARRDTATERDARDEAFREDIDRLRRVGAL
ncbi:MAG: hypothetical protein AAFR11_10960 [Pseudomonadota bacterium]